MIKWLAHNSTAENLIEEASEHLDLRKKALKGKTQNKRIITSILAQRSGDFKVSYNKVYHDGSTYFSLCLQHLEELELGPFYKPNRRELPYDNNAYD